MKFPIRFYCALGVSAALLAFLMRSWRFCRVCVILTKISKRSGNAVQLNGGIKYDKTISNFQDFIPHDELQFVFGETDYPSDTFEMPRISKDNTYNRLGRISLIYVVLLVYMYLMDVYLTTKRGGLLVLQTREIALLITWWHHRHCLTRYFTLK